ncbi:MAG: KamA family radical SAM protein [Thermosulfidibacteraceae bacterium]|jgi:lysine 2,3-aminomutase
MKIYTRLEEIESLFINEDYREEFRQVVSHYPFRISEYILSKIVTFSKDDPIFKQFFPDRAELVEEGDLDPFLEDETCKNLYLVRRYRDRLLVITTNFCFSYCRFCMRKRNWLRPTFFFEDISLLEGYLRENPDVKDVIFSGGDPLSLPNELLRDYLKLLRSLDIPVIRIGSRALILSPDTVFEKIPLIKEFSPIWINFHINHPAEIDDYISSITRDLVKCGAILGSQTVLLKGVNDRVDVLSELFSKLVYIGIRPYYLFHVDPVVGAGHFRVEIDRAIKIIYSLRERLSGLMIPHFAVDTRDGKRIYP